MTLWQDPPPQTRRQARENERSAEQKAAGHASRRAGTAEPTPAGEIPRVTTPYTFSARGPGEEAASPVDRSAAAPAVEQPPIPATAFTEPGVSAPSRPNLPIYGTSFDAVLSPPADDAAPPSASAVDLFRQSPEAGAVEPVTKPVDVVTPPAPVASVAVPAAAVVPPAAGSGERILTRRELRAMQQAQEANQQAGHIEPIVPITSSVAPERSDSPQQAETPAGAAEPNAWPFAPLTPSAASVPTTAVPQTTGYTPPMFTPDADSQKPFAVAPSEAPAVGDEPVADVERQPYQPPVGHWSTAAELDDKNQPFDQIISRSVGASGSATTTNALILPVLPTPDATGPLTSTGEILVTGSIDLPRGLGATGAHPDHIDSSDIDRLLDGEENEFNTSEVAPVRASRAVSTHTSTRGVIAPPKKRHTRLPLILSITAGVLAAGVIGLLIAAYVLRVF